MFDLVIRGATLVTAQERRVADLGITGERVAQIGGDQPLAGRSVLEAAGLFVLPGGVDPHVHLSFADVPMDGVAWTDDFEVGSRAAFAGGITTIGNMTFVHDGEPLELGLERDGDAIARTASADVFLHPVLITPEQHSIAQAQAVWRAGQPSLKLFMSMTSFDAQFAEFFRAMQAAATAQVTVLIHCEDAGCISCCTHLLTRRGCHTIQHFADSRPPASELSAVQRAIGLCELTGCSLYIVHLSTAEALQACRKARARGLPVYVETRPLYLHLTDAALHSDEAGLYVGQPPLRSAADREALWAGLLDGSIDTLASDHAPWNRAAKLDAEHDITNVRPGVADLETMLPMLFSEGVHARGMSLERFVALSSENAARIFGLFPQKGTIAVGSDADLVVWDPACTRTVDGSQMFSRAGYSVYDGTAVTGWPKWTIRRGQVVLSSDRKVQAEPGSGRLIPRSAGQRPR